MKDIIKELRGIVIAKIFSYVSVIIYPIFILFAFYYLFRGTTIELRILLIAAAVWGIIATIVSIIKIKALLLDYKLAKRGEYICILGKIIFAKIENDDDGTYTHEYVVRDRESGEEFEVEFVKDYKVKYDPEKDYICYGLKQTKIAYCEELENQKQE